MSFHRLQIHKNKVKTMEVEMSLGDGFSKRKQLQNEFKTWINRLQLTGKEETTYTIRNLEDKNGVKQTEKNALPGTLRKFTRTYTTQECLNKLKEILEEDKKVAMRISLTNQTAKAQMKDLEGNDVVLTIPELIVLKNEIAPKLEEIERAIPKQSTGVELVSHHEADSEPNIRWRTIERLVEKSRDVTKDGFQRDVKKIVGFRIKEAVDYGFEERLLFDRIDKIQAWQHGLKEAINQANKTQLVIIK